MDRADVIAGLARKLRPDRAHALDADEMEAVFPFLKSALESAFLITFKPLDRAPHGTVEIVVYIHARMDALK